MKVRLLFILGAIGAWILGLLGGWNSAITTLLIFMVADYATGLIVAGIFKKSPNSPGGALQGKACFTGLIRKGMILLVLLIACRLDILLNTTAILDGTCISFIFNELISITENLGLIGVPIPGPIRRAIDVLRTKEKNPDEDSDKTGNNQK